MTVLGYHLKLHYDWCESRIQLLVPADYTVLVLHDPISSRLIASLRVFFFSGPLESPEVDKNCCEFRCLNAHCTQL